MLRSKKSIQLSSVREAFHFIADRIGSSNPLINNYESKKKASRFIFPEADAVFDLRSPFDYLNKESNID